MCIAFNPLSHSLTLNFLCMLLLSSAQLPAMALADTDESPNKTMSDDLDLKTLPRYDSHFINGWMFFGLTKVGLKQKVDEINQQLGPESSGAKLSKDGRCVSFGDGYVGNYYRFEYEEGRIARVRAGIYTCTGGRLFPWMNDRAEALKNCLATHTWWLEISHRTLERHLLGEFDSKFDKDNRRFTITRDLRNIRNYYIARANVLKELGKDNREDVFCARDYDARYTKAKNRYHLEKRLS